MRAASDTDFTIPLPGAGDFVFARRTMGDLIKIRALYLVLIGATENDWQMDLFCSFTAAYTTLIVSHPEGWTDDLAKLDLSSITLEKVTELAELLAEKESSFRRTANTESAQAGPGAIG